MAVMYRIEHWHLDDVSVLAFSAEASVEHYVDLLRAAHVPGVVVVIDGNDEIVGWYPLWKVPVDGTAA